MIIGDNGLLAAIKARIGNLTDHVSIPFVSGVNTVIGYLQTGYYHIHGESFVYPKYAVPVQLTSAVASWATTGTITEVIPAGALAKPFDLHWCSISEISADLFGVIDIYSGASEAEVLIGSVDVNRTINFSREGTAPVQIPQQPAGTRISCKFSDSTTSARTVRVKFYGHFYG